MSQTVITSAFEQLKAQEAANGGVVILDEFVFANIPNLDITSPIDRGEGLPDAALIVHRQAVGKTGMVNNNAVVYSVVMGADVGDFDFNWVGLVNSAHNVVAMIVHAPTQKKIRTATGQQGNVLTRSFLMEYNGASEQTQIITPADTWQIDFTARLNGVDERIRCENIDMYGNASFLGNGFLVQRKDDGYQVSKGVGYVAGLRAELLFEQVINVVSKPVKVWADVCWQGTLISVWRSAVKITAAESLENYVTGDEQHFVVPIAEIQADGSVTDLRTLSVAGGFYNLEARPDTFPYFTSENQANLSGISEYTRQLVEKENAKGVIDHLGLSDPAKGSEYVSGVRKVFRVTDYGAVPDYKISSRTPVTDSTQAFRAAVEDAIAVNGVVYIPSAPDGSAYYITGSILPVTQVGGLWRGASIHGDGLYSSSIYCDCGSNPAIHVKGTSGWPSNIKLHGFSLYAHSQYSGVGVKLQGVCVYEVSDIGIYEFDTGVMFSNGDYSGIFTEFVNCNRLWVKNNNTNIKFRKEGGDPSFHGINFNYCVSNNISGQTGLDIGEGCRIYHADWNQLTFFANTADICWIKNNGARSGNETLFFEGKGYVINTGGWDTGGVWRIQNDTGIITDKSVTPFVNATYITPVSQTDERFASAGFSSVQALRNPTPSEAFRGLLKLRGNNAEGIGVVGYGSGNPESQGLAILSQAYGDGMGSLSMQYLLHLRGIRAFRQNFELSYSGSSPQLSINANGRASGIMGRRTSGTIYPNASPQGIRTTSFYFPESAYPANVTIVFKSADNTVLYSAIYGAASSPVGQSEMKLIAKVLDIDTGAKFEPPESMFVDSTGNTTFTITSAVQLTYTITIVGVGGY